MFSHNGPLPLTAGFDQTNKLSIIVNGFYTGFWSGPAAVILFFIVSGFCIHYPYASGKKFNLKEFYLRRYIRIGIPILIALLLVRITKMVDEGNKDWLAGIPAWSLVAEIIYYSIYPLLYKVLKERWVIITLFSFIISLFFSLTADPENYNYPAWGYWGDWILGLPCWLMGVMMCQSFCNRKTIYKVSFSTIWYYRASGILLGAIIHHLKLQQVLQENITLNWFACFACFWLFHEICFYLRNKPIYLFEYCGLWSYSLYLTHPLSYYLFVYKLEIPNFGILFTWVLCFSFTLLIALTFYYLVEKPSHKLAYLTSKLIKGNN